MKKRIVRTDATAVITVVFAALLALDCAWALAKNRGQAAPNSRDWHFEALGQAPESFRARRNPFQDDPSAVAAGRKLFERHCSECHGRSGEGARRGPGLRVSQVQRAEPGTIFWILANGVVRRGMPDWSKLPAPQRWQIVCFLLSLDNLPAAH